MLGGLSLVAVPILVHLVTREKPKHLRFPAFRFLLQKYHTNRRKLRIHHLLLLLLRMLLIAALCLALARPRLHTDLPTFLGGTQAVEVVMVFDTSLSMEYERGGLTRLEDARRRALELLEELPAGSRVAVLDTWQPAGGSYEERNSARDRIKELQLRPDNGTVSRTLERAYTLLGEEESRIEGANELPPRYLYIFSDRTRASWNADEMRGLKQPEGINVVYIDVGAEKPTDLAIEKIIVDPPAIAPGEDVSVRVLVRATGEKADRKIICQLDNDQRLQEKPLRIKEGSQQLITFDFHAAELGGAGARAGGLAPGPHQVTVRLEGIDRLPFNNVNHATFVVRPGRKVLTLMEEVNPREPWPLALRILGFTSEVRALRDLDKVKLSAFDLVCLYQVSDPSSAWKPLGDYVVGQAGKLAVIPPGTTTGRDSYNNRNAGGQLLPATLDKIVNAPDASGIPWEWNRANKATLMAPFIRWREERSDLEFWKTGGEPRVLRYWQVTPQEQATVIARYTGPKENPPAILERQVESGLVLLFTTTLDLKEEQLFPGPGGRTRGWQNYWKNSFGFVLADKVCRYLAGDSVAMDWNYICGDTVSVPLPRDGGEQFLIRGPGMKPQGDLLSAPDAEARSKGDLALPISRAKLQGNYQVFSIRNEKQEILEAFSLNVKPEESLLTPRVPKEEIEEFLGKDSVLDLEHNTSLREAIDRKPKPVELLPWLMLALLLFLAIENIYANRSREKKPPQETPRVEPEAPPEKPAFSWRPIVLVLLWTALGLVVGIGLSMIRSGPTGSLTAGVWITGLLGAFHGLLTVVRFSPRDGAILGGLLGSMVGVLYGWLILGMSGFDPMFAVFVGLVLAATVMAVDGWLLGLRGARPQPARVEDGSNGPSQ
jgi:hypothetical protein